MNQVYFILRNTEQSGPYSLEDLQALKLTEKDLVKVAGTSSGWFYPYELGIPFILSSKLSQSDSTSQNEEKDIIDKPVALESVPGSNLDEDVDHTIEELSKKITTIRNNLKMVEEKIHAEKEEQVKTVTPKRRMKIVLIIGGVVFFLIFVLTLLLLYYKNFTTSNRISPVSISADQNNNTTAENQFMYGSDTSSVNYSIGPDTVNKKRITDSLAAQSFSKIPAKTTIKKRRTPTGGKKSLQPISATSESTELQPGQVDESRKVAINYVAGEEERKTLLQKIADLFRKKQEPINSSRNPITEDSFEDKIKIAVRTTNYHWLKGVQGLTLTLSNQSSQNIKRATVNVVYYKKDNSVIEKSTVNFSNVKAYKSQTVAAADHPWADHAGYEILAISVIKK